MCKELFEPLTKTLNIKKSILYLCPKVNYPESLWFKNHEYPRDPKSWAPLNIHDNWYIPHCLESGGWDSWEADWIGV